VRAQRDVCEEIVLHEGVRTVGVGLKNKGGQLNQGFEVSYAGWLQAKFTCQSAASCQWEIYDGVEYVIYLTLPEARTSNMLSP
jgi:hypothetical protein